MLYDVAAQEPIRGVGDTPIYPEAEREDPEGAKPHQLRVDPRIEGRPGGEAGQFRARAAGGRGGRSADQVR